MASFADLAVALEYKRVMAGIIKEVMDTERPTYRYGQVTDIDYINQKAQVLYPGEDFPNTVNFGTVEPYAIGQYVRTEGAIGDRYISDTQDGHSVHTGSVRFQDYFKNVDDIRQVVARMWAAENFTDLVARLRFLTSNQTVTALEIRENDGIVYIPTGFIGDSTKCFFVPRGGTPMTYGDTNIGNGSLLVTDAGSTTQINGRLLGSTAIAKYRGQLSTGGPYGSTTCTYGPTMTAATADISVTVNADAGAQGVASSAAFVTKTGFTEYFGTYTGTSMWIDFQAICE